MNKSSTIACVALAALCASFTNAASCPLAETIAFDERFIEAAEKLGRRSRHETTYNGRVPGAVPDENYAVSAGEWYEWTFASRGWARPVIRIWNQHGGSHESSKGTLVWALERLPASILTSLPREVVIAVRPREYGGPYAWALPHWQGAQGEDRKGMWTVVVTQPILNRDKGTVALTLIHEFAHLIDWLRWITGDAPLDPRSPDEVGYPRSMWDGYLQGHASGYALESRQEAFAESMTAWFIGRRAAYMGLADSRSGCDASDYLSHHVPRHLRWWDTWAMRQATSDTGRWFQR